MHVRPEQIIIGAGTEYLYSLLIQLLGKDLTYGLENPGYPKTAKIYESFHVPYHYIDIDKEGKDIMIGFNPKFLMDALRVIDDENVTMYLVNHKSPCFIRDKEENYIYLILPVNFTA